MKKSNLLLPVLFALPVLLFSIDRSSIWIDEGLTFQVIHTSSFSEMFSGIFNNHGANGGMPLFFILEWCWTKVFGYTEIGLRSLNIPFAVIYFIASWHIIHKAKAPSWFCILFFLNPVLLYYMNEARPYVLCIGCIYTYLLFYRNLNDYKTLFGLYISFLMGFLTHMMFVFIILMYLMECVRLVRIKQLNLKKHLVMLSFFAIPYLLLLIYYIFLLKGAREVGEWDILSSDWKASLIQIIYYFTGFGGLGLSRNDLRAMIFPHLTWVNFVCIGLMIAGYLILSIFVIKNKVWKDKDLLRFLLPGGTAFVVFCITNILFQTRFWERHIIYLLPAWLLSLSYILRLMITSKKTGYRIGAILLIGLTMISGLCTMFDPYYKKEDYKSVATYMNETKGNFLIQGETIIYNYYGIKTETSTVQVINNISMEELNKIALEKNTPLFLVLSSRKEFDSEGLYNMSYKTDITSYNSFRIVQYNP